MQSLGEENLGKRKQKNKRDLKTIYGRYVRK
jgi:hypothetical protein